MSTPGYRKKRKAPTTLFPEGWSCRPTGGGHYKIFSPNGKFFKSKKDAKDWIEMQELYVNMPEEKAEAEIKIVPSANLKNMEFPDDWVCEPTGGGHFKIWSPDGLFFKSKKDAKDYMKTGNVAYSVEAPLHTVKNKPKRARIPPPPIDREARIAKPKMPTIIPFPMQKPKTKAKSKKKLKLVPPGTIPLVSSVFSIDSLATIISSTSTTTYNTNPKPKPKLKGIVNSVSTSSLVSLSSFASNSNSTATSNSKNNKGKHPPPPPNYYSSKEYLESEQYIYDTTPVMVFERVGELSLSDDLITCDDQIEEIRIANVQLCWDGRSPSNDAAPMSKYFNRLIGESVKTRTQKKKQKRKLSDDEEDMVVNKKRKFGCQQHNSRVSARSCSSCTAIGQSYDLPEPLLQTVASISRRPRSGSIASLASTDNSSSGSNININSNGNVNGNGIGFSISCSAVSISSSSSSDDDDEEETGSYSKVQIGGEEFDWVSVEEPADEDSQHGGGHTYRGSLKQQNMRGGFLTPVNGVQRGGTAAMAREKGFVTPGWTAYFCPSKRRWLLWAPDSTFFFSLGSARLFEEKLIASRSRRRHRA